MLGKAGVILRLHVAGSLPSVCTDRKGPREVAPRAGPRARASGAVERLDAGLRHRHLPDQHTQLVHRRDHLT
uniref:Uncharacterized protein n=1 Tax=Arundo donax TaxID=35708 RepID=A0A0A9EQD4_ARUDO